MIVWAVETLIASTLLMILVLAIRGPVRRAFGPDIAYALWALPVVRMALPPLPESWRGGALPTLPAAEDITVYLGEPVAMLPAEPVSGIGWPVAALAVWMLGAVAFVAYHVIAHGRFCARVRRDGRVTPLASGRVQMIETDAAAGPLAFGVLRKYVAFPRDFAERYDPLERDLALAHELGHHARGDLIANWVALVMLALHWFNPVAWRAFRAFRADQEVACDALVLAGRARELRQAYGRAIVKSAHGGAVSAACHLHTINEIKGRLRMLTQHERKSRSRLVTGGGAITALLIGGLGLTASGTHAAETVRTSVENAVGVDLAGIDLPTLAPIAPLPPVPPAPPAARKAPVAKKASRMVVYRGDGEVRVMSDADGDEGADASSRTNRQDHAFVVHPRPFVFRAKDGKPERFEMRPFPEMPAEAFARLKNMPRVTSRDCPDGEGAGETVIRHKHGGDVTICTNRIERVAALAARDAERAGRAAFAFHRFRDGSALESLRAARRSIEANDSLSESRRATALAGIDQAIREMESKRND